MTAPAPFALADAPLNRGTVLLEASAGTGKTFTITGVLVRMLLEDVIEHVEQALVVTFTVAAAEELKNRLREGLRTALRACRGEPVKDDFFASLAKHGDDGVAKLRRALDEFDRASVMTIHGFCKRLLEESAFESDQPFELEFTADDSDLQRAAAEDALRTLREHDGPMLAAVLRETKMAPARLLGLFRAFKLYPGATVEPREPQVADNVAELNRVALNAAASCDDQLIELLASLDWLKNKEPKPDACTYLREHLDDVAGRPERALTCFKTFAASPLRKLVKKNQRSRLDHVFFTRCDDVRLQLETTMDHLRVDLLTRMDRRLSEMKREGAVLTFDDMLQTAHEATTSGPSRDRLLQALRSRYTVALIDEFQDTDRRQYELLAAAFEDRPLFLVGDPKQSIYGFRGADLRTYLAAAADAVDRCTLGTNYRSSRQVVAGVNELFARPDAFVARGVTMHAVDAAAKPGENQLSDDCSGPAIRFRTPPLELDDKGLPAQRPIGEQRAHIAADVAAEIARLVDGSVEIDDKRLQPRHIAVLTRTNKEATLIQSSLRDVGVVAVIGKSGDVFKTAEIHELDCILQAVLRPTDPLGARAAMATKIWGLDALALAALDRDDLAAEQHLAKLENWRRTWGHRGFGSMREQMLRDLDAYARLLDQPGGERSLTNLLQVCEMLQDAEQEQQLSPESLLDWLRRERANPDPAKAERRELRLESDEDAVQVQTMHGSKGLEYEVVFCPFLWSGAQASTSNVALPAASADASAPRHFRFACTKSDAGWLQYEADRLAEDVRLTYVALTRAKRRCYVHWGPMKGYQNSALAWLLDPDVTERQPGWQTSWSDAYKANSASMYLELDRRASIKVEPMNDRDPCSDSGAAAATRPPVPAERRRAIPWREPKTIHSFTSLVAQREPDETTYAGRDATAAPGSGIFGFARGANAGTCLHDILEHVDFTRLDSDETERLIRKTLAEHHLDDPGVHPGAIHPFDAVQRNLHDLALARTNEHGPTIGQLCTGHRLAEWKFLLPMSKPQTRELAALFAAHGDDLARQYAPHIEKLRPLNLSGFLTGFADMVSEHEGRYWLLDWKSNHLGEGLDAYDADALSESMQAHHYILQYHLYVVAWHRHLTARLADYDYDRHFGGICYAFLRGASPNSENGMFYDRPPRALVEAMDNWIRGEA